MKYSCNVFKLKISLKALDKKYHEIRQKELKDKSDFAAYWKKYKTINNEEKKEKYALVLEKLRKKVKEDKILDGDLVENISESGYRTNGVYVIEKKGNSIKVADIGREYDDYGHIDDRFSLSEERPLGYWNNASFEKAYWHSEDLPEPIWTKFMKAKDIKPDGDGGSDIDLKWCVLKFPMKPSKALSLLKKAKEDKLKAFYFLKEYSPDYTVEYAKLDMDWLPIDVNKLTQQQIKPTKEKKPKSKRPSPSQSATLFSTGQKKGGNDGNMYQVKENKNGVKRWVKVKETVPEKPKLIAPKEKKQGKEKKEKKVRPSPSQSATLFSVGQKKQGNDGNLYQIKQNKNGVKRWVKVKK